MRVLNAVKRILLLLLAIPAIAIVVDMILQAIDAQKSNPIVRGIDSFAGRFILPEFQDVFARRAKQTDFQDGLVALIALGLLALIIVFVFRALRAMASARPPRKSGAPKAPAATKSTRKTTSDSTTAAAPKETASAATKDKTTADSSAGTSDDTKSSST